MGENIWLASWQVGTQWIVGEGCQLRKYLEGVFVQGWTARTTRSPISGRPAACSRDKKPSGLSAALIFRFTDEGLKFCTGATRCREIVMVFRFRF